MPAAEPDEPTEAAPSAPRRGRVHRIGHLTRRFAGMLVPIAPRAEDSRWALEHLSDGEQRLWARMKSADRRHSVKVARRVDELLGQTAPRPVLAAALLHDVGKLESGLGVYGRTVATLSAAATGHDQDVIADWTRTKGFTRRVGLYLQHPALGADLLELAGSDPLVVTWTREHHLPAEQRTVPPEVGAVLEDADDD